MPNTPRKAPRTAQEAAAIHAAYDDFLTRLGRLEITRQALAVGQTMVPFLLPNAEGRLVASEDLLRRGSLVVTFFRGDWCPYCVMALEALEAALPEIEAAGATLVAITPETGGRALAAKRSLGLSYEVLADADNVVAMQFGIVFRTPAMYRTLLERAGIDLAKRQGNPGWLLPVPATFLVGSNGMVRHAWVDVDFQQRAKPAEVVQLLRALRDGGPAPAPVPSPPHGEPA